MGKSWDVFISHASEDKDFVVPLARGLKGAGLRVWLDAQELNIGDSLREKIDEGLAESRFGVVVISRRFLDKGWPRKELNGLVSLEEPGRTLILPIWHRVSAEEVRQFSPILSDRVAVNSAIGMPNVVRSIAQVVLKATDPTDWTLKRRLIHLLDQTESAEEVRRFLNVYLSLAARAIDPRGLGQMLTAEELLNLGGDADFACVYNHGSSRMVRWTALMLGPPWQPVFDEDGELGTGVLCQFGRAQKFAEWLSNRGADSLDFTILAFRRDLLEATQSLDVAVRALPSLGVLSRTDAYSEKVFTQPISVEIRTYDYLIDLADFSR